MKYITEIQKINNTTFDIDNQSLYEYDEALKDLSGTQSALLLSTQGVSNAQIQQTLAIKGLSVAEQHQAMTEAGLLANKKKLSNIELQSAIASATSSEAKAYETMKVMGLTVAKKGEEAQTVKLTSKKLQEAVASGILTQAEAEEIGVIVGVTAAKGAQNAAMPLWIANMKALTLATWEQVKATLAWLATNPVGWIIGIGAAIAGVIALFNYQSKAGERATEKISELREEYSNSVSELESLKNELESVNQKIDELQSKGKLSFTDKEELTNLQKQSTELQKQYDIQQKISQQKATDVVEGIRNNQDAFDKDFDGSLRQYLFDKNELESQKEAGLRLLESGQITIERYESTIADTEEALNESYGTLLEQISKFEENRQSILDKYNGDVSSMSFVDKNLYNNIVEQLNQAYKEIYSKSEYNKFVIEPIFNTEQLDGLQQQIVDYFINNGEMDIEALEEKFGTSIIEALRVACENAGIELDVLLSELFNQANNTSYGFAPMVDNPNSAYEAKQRAQSMQKLDYYNTLDEETKGLIIEAEVPENVKNGTLEDFKKWIAKLQSEAKITISTEWTLSESQIEAVDNYQSKVASLGETLNKLRTGQMTSEDYTNLFKEFPQLVDESENLESAIQELIYEALETLRNQLGKEVPEAFKDSLQDTADQAALSVKTIATSIADVEDGYKLLEEVKEDMASGSIGSSTLQNIISKYPDMQEAVNAYCAGLITEQELYEELEKYYNADYEAFQIANQYKMYTNEFFYQESLEKNGELVNELAKKYELDFKNFKTVQDAKRVGEAKLIGELTSLWDEYYSIVLGDDGFYQVKQIKHGYDVENNSDYQSLEETRLKVEQFLNDLKQTFGLDIDFDMPEITGNTGSGSDSDTKERFDWIEKAIQRIQEALARITKVRDNVYKTWSTRNSALAQEIGTVNQELQLQMQAYQAYMDYANAVPLADEYKQLVMSGAMRIDEITDETLKEQINDFTEWYEKAIACYDAAEDLKIQLSELAETRFTNISAEFENRLSLLEARKTQLDNAIAYTEARGYVTSSKLYESLIETETSNLDGLKAERDALIASLNESVSTGIIEAYSEKWYELVGQINDITAAVQESEAQIIEFQNEIRQLDWDNFDRLLETISRITEESDFLISLMENSKMFNGKGVWTDEGLATLGQHAVNYNTFMAQADKYANELVSIQDELAKDPYNQTLIERERELQDAQRDTILSAEQEKQAMIDLAKEGFQEQIDAMQELIDKKKEALDAEKSLYDYQKTIAEKTKSIADLQKRLVTAEQIGTEEGRAEVQQLREQLAEAEKDLQETEYDKWLQDQQDMLDDLMEEYQELMNAMMDDTNELLQNLIEATNTNASNIAETVKEKVDEVGYVLTSEMSNIWSTSGEIGSIVSQYGDNFETHLTTVNETLRNIDTNNQNMITSIDNLGNNLITAINGLAGALNTSTGSGATGLPSLPTTPTTSTTPSEPMTNGNNGNGNNVNTGALNQKVSGASGSWYYTSNGGVSGSVNRFSPDYFIVDAIDDDAEYPYHIQAYINGKAAGGNGWVKGVQIGYKTGLKRASKDHWAWTQEEGTELIYRASDGAMLTPIGQDGTVFTKEMTDNLWNIAKGNYAIPQISTITPQPVSTHMANGDVVISIDNMNLPNVTNPEQFANQFVDTLKNNTTVQKAVRSVSVDLLAGKPRSGIKQF